MWVSGKGLYMCDMLGGLGPGTRFGRGEHSWIALLDTYLNSYTLALGSVDRNPYKYRSLIHFSCSLGTLQLVFSVLDPISLLWSSHVLQWKLGWRIWNRQIKSCLNKQNQRRNNEIPYWVFHSLFFSFLMFQSKVTSLLAIRLELELVWTAS